MCLYIFTDACIYINTCIYVYIYTHTCVYIYVYKYTRVYIYICVCIYVYMYICVCVYICICYFCLTSSVVLGIMTYPHCKPHPPHWAQMISRRRYMVDCRAVGADPEQTLPGPPTRQL